MLSQAEPHAISVEVGIEFTSSRNEDDEDGDGDDTDDDDTDDADDHGGRS